MKKTGILVLLLIVLLVIVALRYFFGGDRPVEPTAEPVPVTSAETQTAAPTPEAAVQALAEAMALNLADNTDARLETVKEILGAARNHGCDEWLGFNRLLDSNFRKTSDW